MIGRIAYATQGINGWFFCNLKQLYDGRIVVFERNMATSHRYLLLI